MFKASITATPFTTDTANDYFENITGALFGNDHSFLATIRALVAPRIPRDDSLYLFFGSSNYHADEVKNASIESVVRAILRNINVESAGFIYIHNFTNTSENNMASMACIRKKFTDMYPQFSRLDAITAFYAKTFNVDCYISPSQKSVMVFVDGLDNRRLHYLQCSILAMLPWYFDKDAGVTQKEMELMRSLRETSSEKYLSILYELASQYDFKTARVRRMLAGFESRYERVEYQRVKEMIDSIDYELDRLNEQLGSKLAKRNEHCIMLAGLDRRINETNPEESEIMEYFLCNSKLYLENVTDTDMYFCVKDYVTYFDKDIVERMLTNDRSAALRYVSRDYNMSKVKKLLTEIFLSDTPRLKVKTCAAYRFNLNGSVSGQSGHRFSAEFNDCIPNMHIQKHSCLGSYANTLNQLLRNRDYIGALEQCIASCKSLNFGDGVVIEEFFRELFTGTKNRCIELPDGRVVKPAEAIYWLDEQEQRDTQTENQTEEAVTNE